MQNERKQQRKGSLNGGEEGEESRGKATAPSRQCGKQAQQKENLTKIYCIHEIVRKLLEWVYSGNGNVNRTGKMGKYVFRCSIIKLCNSSAIK